MIPIRRRSFLLVIDLAAGQRGLLLGRQFPADPEFPEISRPAVSSTLPAWLEALRVHVRLQELPRPRHSAIRVICEIRG